MENNESNKNRIAIVGLDCRLPGADNVEEFWKNLVAEKESFSEFSEEQLLAAGVTPAIFNNPNYVRKRGIVEGADQFDAEFFSFTPREAELLDPQHRLFLECAWHALEDAGIDPFNTDRKIAVFGGTGSPYHLVDTIGNKSVKKFATGTAIVTSNDKDYLTTRVSYKLNLNGPSVNVQSACSTSIVGVVLGIDSLLNYQSDVVLAGGATIELPEHKGYMYQSGGLESPDGKCRTFDKDAAGTAFSRGCGVVALKRLEDALDDKDHIYAVILGGAVNNDGNRKAGYTAPSVQGQVEVITETIELSGIDPSTITMVEAHGTSTPVGDPIEVASLTESFAQYTANKGYCAIGSVKTNIGHADVASGVASLIKTSLSLKHGIIPASLNFHEPNPALNFDDSPFYVNTKTKQWERQNGTPARALLNSFGVGGTNACLILEEPPRPGYNAREEDYDLLFISAHHKNSFKEYCARIKAHLEEYPEANLNALAHTSRVARRSMKYKGAIAFKDRADFLARLETGVSPVTSASADGREVVWMFSGQGNQFVNMGRELYVENRVFRETIDHCAEVLKGVLNLDIREILYPADDAFEQAAGLIDRTYITQPAIFMVNYGVARVFQSFGLRPDAMIGHSVGEYVAAAVSDIMTLEDALKSVAFRGKLVYDLPQGSMLAVLKSEPELKKILPAELDIAVVNSPELSVVSGSTPEVKGFAAWLRKEGVVSKMLPTSHAFHSRMMVPCLDSYREFFKGVSLHSPTIPIISTVTGQILSDDQAKEHEYWVQHVIKPVLFSEAAAQKRSSGSAVFLECGPGQSLESAIKRSLKPEDTHTAIGTLYEQEDAIIALDAAIGKLWVENVVFDYDLRFNSRAYHKVPFPLLPFNRKSYRIDFSANADSVAEQENVKKEDIGEWFYIPSWKRTASVDRVVRNEVEASSLPARWIVFSKDKFSDAIAARIRAKGMDCVIVRPGDHYREEQGTYFIRIDEKDDYRKLFERLASDDYRLHVIHAWNFSSQPGEEISLNNATQYLDQSFYSLMYLEQGLIATRLTGQTHLTCIVDNCFNVTGRTDVQAEKSLSIGPIRVLFKEHPEVSTKLINLEMLTVKEDMFDKLIDQLIRETEVETDETIISYSGTDRWTETFESVSLTGQQDRFAGSLKENGVYLITGGGGGIGRTLSLAIAEKVKSRIIWTGRGVLPPRQEWEALIAGEDTDLNLKEKLETIRQVEQLGTTVHYYSVEVSDAEGMRTVVAEIEANIGAISGVVHSAGTAGGGVVELQEKNETEKVLSPKVLGTLVIREIFKDKPLDFVYLFSSITAIFGEAGRVDYISGNAFLDAISHSHFLDACGTFCSVNWGQWGQVGMAADWQRESGRNKSRMNIQNVQALPATETNKPVEVHYLSSEGARELYRVEVNADDHWVLNEHLLSGMPTLVGTAYVDILMKWKTLKGIEKGGITIKNSVFSSPLIIVNKAPVNLQLVCEQTEQDQYRFVFRSSTGSQADNWKEHFSGELLLHSQVHADKKVDINFMIDGYASAPETQRHFTVMRDGNNKVMLQYSSRWDCKQAIYSGEDEWLCKLELPGSFAQDFDFFQIHPSMLDVATSAHFIHMKENTGVFLPYSYGEMQIYHPFTPCMYAQVKFSNGQEEKDKYLYFDIDLYDEAGEVILSLKEYGLVKVSEIPPSHQKTGVELQKKREVFEDDDILPDEGKRVFEILFQQTELPQVVVYTKDLSLDFKESKISYVRRNLKKRKQLVEENRDVDDRPDIDTPYEAPGNEIEKSIAAIWSSMLGINKLGVHDSFIELGGNSLLAIQVISGIGEEFGVELEASEFVNHPTISSLGELVLTKILEEHDSAEIEKVLNAESVSP